ncbi:MAG: hypothetical protein QOD77_1773 [Thermoplasmata archaeon]|jgi:hypothetical protein|nr:hypothetical protein [Thermoplasmata archaeon]
MRTNLSRTALAACLVVVLAGCTVPPSRPEEPSAPEPLGTHFEFVFPTDQANLTYAVRLLPTAQDGLSRVYLSGGSAAEAVALDPVARELGRGSAPGSAYAVAAVRHDGVGTVFLESEPGPVVYALQESDLRFTLMADKRSGYHVGNAVLHQGVAYALLLDPDGLDAHRLVKVEGDHLVDVALDPAVDRGLNVPSLGSDGQTLALCQRQGGVLEAAILDDEGALVEQRVLDPLAFAGATSCVAAQAEGLHAFAWKSATGQTMLARLQAGQLATEIVALNKTPQGIWVLGNATFVLAQGDGWTDLLMKTGGSWTSCRVQEDPRDHVMLYPDAAGMWVFRLPYSSEGDAGSIVGDRLDPGPGACS